MKPSSARIDHADLAALNALIGLSLSAPRLIDSGIFLCSEPYYGQVTLKFLKSAEPEVVTRRQRRLVERGVAAPAVLAWGHLAQRPFIIQAWCPGRRPHRLRPQVARDVVRTLASARGGEPAPNRHWRAKLSKRLAIALPTRSTQAEGLFDALRTLVARDLAHVQPAADLVHFDLLPSNLLVRHGRLAAILDWEYMTVGDASYDLVHLALWRATLSSREWGLQPLWLEARAATPERAIGVYAAVAASTVLASAIDNPYPRLRRACRIARAVVSRWA